MPILRVSYLRSLGIMKISRRKFLKITGFAALVLSGVPDIFAGIFSTIRHKGLNYHMPYPGTVIPLDEDEIFKTAKWRG